MLNFLRRLLSPDLRQARRLLKNGSGTSRAAFESAAKIEAMPSFLRHKELRLLRAGCLLNGMGLPEEMALQCASVDLACLEEFELADFAAEALRMAARDCQDDGLRERLLQAIEGLPGLKRIRVIGELYDPTRAKTAQTSIEETEIFLYATATGPALAPAYQQYKEFLEARGYEVSGKLVNQFYELCLFSTWA